MTIQWASLLAVFGVSLGSTIAVVALVTVAMVGLSARAARPPVGAHRPVFSPRAGTVVAGACLAAATVIVLFGLWTLVTR